jgi:ribosomal protein S6--L-glutamate ligase
MFLLARRQPPVPSPLLLHVFDRLRARGFAVEGVIAEEELFSPEALKPEHDLYILKSHTELSLSLAGALHATGARLLNPYPACAAAQNKIIAACMLRAAGVPIPDSWVGDPGRLRPLLESHPLVAKPYRGHRGVGVSVVRGEGELVGLSDPSGPLLYQRLLEGPGEDLKVYVVGDEVMAVKKRFDPDSFTRPGRPVEVTPEVGAIAAKVGAAFGLGLFGMDLIETDEGPFVVDLNYFPGYKGLSQAPGLVADYITDYARGRLQLSCREVS